MKVRPGQVYWNGTLGNRVVVYSVQPGVIRVVMVTAYWNAQTARSIAWKHGVPQDYALQYDPPKRRAE